MDTWFFVFAFFIQRVQTHPQHRYENLSEIQSKIAELLPDAHEHIGQPSDLKEVQAASQLLGNVGQPLMLSKPAAPAPTMPPVQKQNTQNI